MQRPSRITTILEGAPSAKSLLARASSLLLLALLSAPAAAQYNERPSLVGSGLPGVDASGRSVKNERVRAVHTTDPDLLGGTAYLFERDPFLAYQLGRNLNFREFRSRDGVFSASVGGLAGPMPDGTTAKITANNQTSCLGCHNLPPGNPGGGTNFHKDSGLGRNAPHYYGAGLVESLALQVSRDLTELLDRNGDGWVNVAEAQASPDSLRVRPTPGAAPIDYGRGHLSAGTTGKPGLNNIFRVWYVDANGKRVPGATEVDGVTTLGYRFNMIVWGWGQGPGRAALNPTNRAFYWDPANTHSGMEAFDPSTLNDPDGDGVSEPTLAGCEQFPATHVTPDQGTTLDPLGFSRQDPDGDGHLNEISEGDLDLAEWFMLNAPRPAFAGTPRQFRAGVEMLRLLECTSCHVPSWQLRAAAEGSGGDRRFFDFETRWNPGERRLEGRLVPLYDEVGASYVLRREGFRVEGFFSDLVHHEMGEDFAELDFSGFRNTLWRTPPLWGVGSGFPWGHDGKSLTLDDVIRRHGGEAAKSRDAYLALPMPRQQRLVSFLSKLVLYDVETLPADIDGDGQISQHFMVAGMDTGVERFNAEWLFREPARIQGPVLVNGEWITSFAATNIDEAYGQLLPLRLDSDSDGWPDVWDHAPLTAGFQNGEM